MHFGHDQSPPPPSPASIFISLSSCLTQLPSSDRGNGIVLAVVVVVIRRSFCSSFLLSNFLEKPFVLLGRAEVRLLDKKKTMEKSGNLGESGVVAFSCFLCPWTWGWGCSFRRRVCCWKLEMKGRSFRDMIDVVQDLYLGQTKRNDRKKGLANY